MIEGLSGDLAFSPWRLVRAHPKEGRLEVGGEIPVDGILSLSSNELTVEAMRSANFTPAE